MRVQYIPKHRIPKILFTKNSTKLERERLKLIGNINYRGLP